MAKVMVASARFVAVVVSAAAIVTGGAGCSAIASRPPPDRPLRDLSECSRSPAPPILDVVGAGLSGGFGAAVLAQSFMEKGASDTEVEPSWSPRRRSEWSTGTSLTIGLVGVAAAVALSASATHGFRSVKACRVASRDLRWQERPPRLPPPGYLVPSPGYAPAPPAYAPPPSSYPPAPPPAESTPPPDRPMAPPI